MASNARVMRVREARSAPSGLTRQWSMDRAIPSWWPLLVVLTLQATVALTTLRNTAFQDEALYVYAGHQIFRYWTGGPAPLEQYAFYFSGYPDFYPVLGGILDRIGGLELARAFSLACMLGVTTIVYLCTQKLFHRGAATFASAAYASLGTVLFVSRLATFDALCLLLIALSAAIAFRISAARSPWLALTLGPLLVLAFLAKYVALLFVPTVLGLVIFGTIAFQGWSRMLSRIAITVVTLGVSIAVAYRFMDKVAFHAIGWQTAGRVPIVEKPRLELLLHVLYMGGIVYAAALVGLVLVFFRHPRFRLVALILFGSSLLTPAYHIYTREVVSLDKHVAYSLFFAMPLAGYAIAWLAGDMERLPNARGHYGLAGIAVVLIVLTLGMQQSQAIYAGWANTSNLSSVLHTQMRDGTGRYLVEDIEVARYDTLDISEPWQWNGLGYIDYGPASGQPPLAQAIQERYFALVELSFIYQRNRAYFVAEKMAASRNYDLIARIIFHNSNGSGYFYIWRSAPVAGNGNFTSMSQVGT